VQTSVDEGIHRAIAYLRAGQGENAAHCVGASLAGFVPRNNKDSIRCSLAGLIYLAAKQLACAVEWFERALFLEPGNTEALAGRGLALQELGKTEEALSSYEAAVSAGCVKPELFYNRGNLLRVAGRLGEAIASYDEALRLRPAYPEALRAGGLVLSALGHNQSALEFFDEALRLKPAFLDVLIDRGNVLQSLDRPLDAVQCYDAALAQAPNRADILNNRGSALCLAGRLSEAREDFRAALKIAPSLAQAWMNQGNLLLKLQEPAAALASFDEALRLKPQYVEALGGRAVALKYLCRFDEALAAFDAALDHDSSAHIKNNKGALLLLRGDFEEGLELYEYRWISAQTPKIEFRHSVKEWKGEDLEGHSIAVLDELGHGDAIQFARYLPIMVRAGGRVTFFCRGSLRRLFLGLGSGVQIATPGEAEENFDYQIAESSLPRAFRTRLETIPANVPYLHAEQKLVERWAARIGAEGFRIGICWRGNQNIKSDPSRSLPLKCFASLADIGGVRLISLQKDPGAGAAPLPGLLTFTGDFDAGPDTFIDTAAIMKNLDLVVTCDTSIAHLAGALGRPVFVLLKQVPDWRWLLDREDSPWYPSMRLFRQKTLGDWNEVMDRVAEAVAHLCTGLE